MSNKKFKILSLFSSAGIAEFGLDKERFQVVLANELLKNRADVHEYWHSDSEMICGDITDDKIKTQIIRRAKDLGVNFILATPPCQGMSLIGKNKSNEQMLRDARNYLIFHTFDIIDEINPDVVLIENVGRFLKIKYPDETEYKTIDQLIYNKFSNKYKLDYDVYDVADYGVPQHRERAIIKLWKHGLNWGNPRKSKQITVREAIGDLPSLEAGEKSSLLNHYARNHTKENILWMKHTPTGCSAVNNKTYHPINKKTGKRIKCYPASYKRIDWDKPAPTITMRNDCIASQSNVHPGRKLKDGTYSDARVLTLRELFILSSVDPDISVPSFASDIQIRHIIGEAVPPKLIRVITDELKEIG